MNKKAIIIDANHLLSRTFHVPAFQALKTTIDGAQVMTGATFGFLNSLKGIVEKHQKPDDTLVVVWDSSGGSFRKELCPSYKANRTPRTQEFIFQLDLTKEFLKVLGIIQCEQYGVEADDIIATLARRAKVKDYDVLIISGDKDFNQLVDDKTNVLNPKGHNEYILMTPQSIEEHYGVGPKYFADYLALLGDSSDNVAGIDGVGKKTAAEIIRANGSIHQICNADVHFKFDKDNIRKPVTDKLQVKLNESKEIIKLAKQLVILDRDFNDFQVTGEEPDFLKLKSMFKQYSFRTLLLNFNEFVAVFS
jgi:DNA polymerase-1